MEFALHVILCGHEALFGSLYAVSVVTYSVFAMKPLGDWAMAVSLRQTLDFESQGRVRTLRCAPELVVRRDGEGWLITYFRNRRIDRGDTAAVWPSSQNRAA